MDEYEQALADEGYEDEVKGKCPRCFGDTSGEDGVCASCREELLAETAEYQDEDQMYLDSDDDLDDDFDDDVVMRFTCSACNGTGQDWDLTPCQECDGEGFYYWK